MKGPVVRSAVSTPHRVEYALLGEPAVLPTHTSNVPRKRWQQSSRLYTTTEVTLEPAGTSTDSHGLATLKLEMQKFQPLSLFVTPSMHWPAPKSCPGKLAAERVELIDAPSAVIAVAGEGDGGGGDGDGGGGDGRGDGDDGDDGGGDGGNGDTAPALPYAVTSARMMPR